jgi:5-methylcytosine-specific restriction endonuclease McrA
LGTGVDNRDMARRRTPEEKRLDLFRKKMQEVSVYDERATSINSAFAAALAQVGKFDVGEINAALEELGQGDATKELTCVYCDEPAEDADHLKGLVLNKRYSGHGQVIGNLVPCCKSCNSRKQNRPWQQWADIKGVSTERRKQIVGYETLAPPPVSEDQLRELYPDLMQAYERLKHLCHDAMRAADDLAREIRRLEKKRLEGQGFGEIAEPDET